MSNNSDDIRLLIIQESNQNSGNPEPRLTAAKHKTRSLLLSWRSRFASPKMSAKYKPATDERVDISSDSDGQVHVARTQGQGMVTVYDLDVTRTGVELNVVEHSDKAQKEEAPQDETSRYEALSEILFACDRIEVRGIGRV